MDATLTMLFDLNDDIYATWTTYITINTAVTGWILTKKGDFNKAHAVCAGIAFVIYSYSMSNFLLPQYDFRYAVVADLKEQAVLQLKEDKKEICIVGKKAELDRSGIRQYICTFTPPSKTKAYGWMVVVSLMMFLLFYLDYKKQFSKVDDDSG